MTSLDISESLSVLGDVPLGVHDGLHAAGHGVGEGGEELLLPAENLPGARDLLGEIVQVQASIPAMICLSSRQRFSIGLRSQL